MRPANELFTKEEILNVFRRMCFSRFFEFKVKEAYDAGHIKCPVYLSVGQEAISSALAVSFPGAAIFAQHRCHDFYLANDGNPIQLIDELLGRSTGCAGGMGGSASIQSPEIPMFGHDGLMGTQIPIAVGYAQATKHLTLAIMGDASAEEDFVLPAIGYAVTKKLPILFVCTDNNLSILTETKVRRSWNISKLVASMDIPSIDMEDDPWSIMHYIGQRTNFPAFMNIRYTRILWHAGTGMDSKPEFDRYEFVKQQIVKFFSSTTVEDIETLTKIYLDDIWKSRIEAKE